MSKRGSVKDLLSMNSSGFGYLRHENRSEKTDRLLIDAANDLELGLDQLSNWADSSYARHFMDQSPKTLKVFKKELQRFQSY